MSTTVASGETLEVAQAALARIHDAVGVLQGLDLAGMAQDEHGEWLEVFLTVNAAQLGPTVLGRLATRAVDTFDPDGVLRDVEYRARVREFGLIRHRDGSSTPTGAFTAELSEYLLVAMD